MKLQDGKMIPGCEELADNIKRLVDSLALEIARRFIVERVGSDVPLTAADMIVRERVAHHARLVLLDWFLGDFLPDRKPAVSPGLKMEAHANEETT